MAESLKPALDTQEKPVSASRYRVLFSYPLPSLDTAHARAYQAQHAGGDKDFCAYVCDRRFFPRLRASAIFARLRYKSLMQFQEWFLLRDNEGIERVVLIYKNPSGMHLYLDSLNGATKAIGLRECVKYFIRPLLRPLQMIHTAGLTYRAFSPTNLFVRSDDKQAFTLGQCMSDPAGTMQPIIFETPTCAMAEAQGRGSEIAANDYYALGVMILTLLRGHVPLLGDSEETVLLQKMRLGSFRAMLEHAQLEAECAELLRGLLDDNPGTRWGYEEVIAWIGGYRRSAKTHFTPPRAKVPFYLGKQAITTRQEMSYMLHKNWHEALKLSQQAELGHWLRRSFADDADARDVLLLRANETNSQKINQNAANSSSSSSADNLTRTLILLDPLAPILRRGSGFTITGIGNMLAQCYNQPAKTDALISMLRQGIHDFWLRHHIYNAPVYSDTVNLLTGLIQRTLNDDSEIVSLRFFYTLNHDAPCMSALFARDYVYGLENLIERLEEKQQSEGEGTRLTLDSHLFAYISAYHQGAAADTLFATLRENNPVQNGLAQVRLLNIVQQYHNRIPAYRLCKTLQALLEPALERFHNLETRKLLQQSLFDKSQAGWIEPMLKIADNPVLLAQDAKAYHAAQRHYRKNNQELNQLAHAQQDMHAQVSRSARNAAMTTSSGLMVAGFITMLLRLI